MTTRNTDPELDQHPLPTPQPQQPTKRARRLPRLDLSATQLIATALAAITATVAASYLGVSGTVVGAAVASVLTAVGNAVYGHSLRSTRDRVRDVVPAAARFGPHAASGAAPGAPTAALPAVRDGVAPIADRPPVLPTPVRTPHEPGRGPWRHLAIGAVTVFATVLAVVTGVEVVAGRPLSDLLRGDSGSGTTLFGGDTAAHSGTNSTPPKQGGAPTVTETVTPSVVVTTPTVTRTAAPVTKTATPTLTPSTSSPGAASSTTTSPGGTSRTPAP